MARRSLAVQPQVTSIAAVWHGVSIAASVVADSVRAAVTIHAPEIPDRDRDHDAFRVVARHSHFFIHLGD